MNSLTFFPAQPEIQYKMDDYKQKRPLGNTIISKNIALFYQFKAQKGVISSFALIPDGSIDIVFCCCPKKPSIFLWTSPLQRSEPLNFDEECEYFGVRLFPEQKVIEFEYSMRELLGKKIILSDVASIDNFMLEEILNEASFSERICLFEKFIERNSDETQPKGIIEYSINQIYSCKGNINIKQLSIDAGYSDRYIRKKFLDVIGFPPKKFSEMVRFQNSLGAMILNKENYNPLDIVYQNGYHDQAHFIKGFKKFTDLTPTQFMYKLQ